MARSEERGAGKGAAVPFLRPIPQSPGARFSARRLSLFSHRISLHLDAVSVMHQPVKDAIGERGSPICSCHFAIGTCEVNTVERVW